MQREKCEEMVWTTRKKYFSPGNYIHCGLENLGVWEENAPLYSRKAAI